MKIEVLYVPGCPNHTPAVEVVTRVLASESLPTELCQVPVRSEGEARALRFPGSPTIRINGRDVEPESAFSYGLACRLYGNGAGLPGESAIRTAVSVARKEE